MWAKRLKDKNFRLSFKKNEEVILPLHFLLQHTYLEPAMKIAILKKLQYKSKRNFSTQIKNRCVLSLRSRSPIKFFRLSRIFFRSSASNGFLLGVKKSSW